MNFLICLLFLNTKYMPILFLLNKTPIDVLDLSINSKTSKINHISETSDLKFQIFYLLIRNYKFERNSITIDLLNNLHKNYISKLEGINWQFTQTVLQNINIY